MTPPDYDAVVALGTRVRAGGRPSAGLRRRTGHAVHLALEGRAGAVILCGGEGAHPPAEAHLMREMALAAGLPDERIVLEAASANTFENAVNAARILHDRGWRRILVVSDGYHLPRALFVFRRLGLVVDGSAAPASPHDRAWFAAAVRLREVAAWAWYLYRVFARDRRIISAHRAGAVRGYLR